MKYKCFFFPLLCFVDLVQMDELEERKCEYSTSLADDSLSGVQLSSRK